MKKVTLKDIEWQKSPNFYEGRSASVSAIVLHQWDDPAKKPSMNGVVSWFKNPAAEVSAHFVVSNDRIVQMVNMGDTAWHARQANPFTVGIEIDPRAPGNTNETVAALIKFIRSYYPKAAIKRHSDYVNTRCPNFINVDEIKRRVAGTYKTPIQPPAPKPTASKYDDLYRVYAGGKQKGAFADPKNAYELHKTLNKSFVKFKANDVTRELAAKYAPTKDQQQDKTIADVNARLAAVEKALAAIKSFLSNLFKSFK